MKNYSGEIFAVQLKSTKFPDHSNFTCMNDTQELSYEVFSVVSFVAPMREKSKARPWFDIDVLNTIRSRDKHYRKFKRSDKEIHKGNYKC